MPAFVNELRSSYCDIQGARGMHSFLFASSTSIHGMINDVQWNAALIGGTLLRDWVANAMSDPDGVIEQDRDRDDRSRSPRRPVLTGRRGA